jgi:curli production assembly/transport component CsgF
MEMKKLVIYIGCGVVFGFFLLQADITTATELVWTPVNPSFGGLAYNADWLLASANAQNKYADQQQSTSTAGDLIQDFKTNVQRQVLSRLADRIIGKAFGEEGLDEGFYDLGDFTVNVGTDVTGINVVLIDKTRGSQTTIQIPYY